MEAAHGQASGRWGWWEEQVEGPLPHLGNIPEALWELSHSCTPKCLILKLLHTMYHVHWVLGSQVPTGPSSPRAETVLSPCRAQPIRAHQHSTGTHASFFFKLEF